jgi:hypothetical protein
MVMNELLTGGKRIDSGVSAIVFAGGARGVRVAELAA